MAAELQKRANRANALKSTGEFSEFYQSCEKHPRARVLKRFW